MFRLRVNVDHGILPELLPQPEFNDIVDIVGFHDGGLILDPHVDVHHNPAAIAAGAQVMRFNDPFHGSNDGQDVSFCRLIQGFLQKPFRSRNLHDLLRQVLGPDCLQEGR